ncbi:succinyldiaminopimelate transaminase [Usitatibacter palustris]|uniref:LL-diaminopimelate aminotransferase n=1 Tax=Usitatibacter palustris TaxID=2732487 RepID=A0A6M4H597_9PROT|nr:succinyldiaminopimelate transaminase [Usitatibacter palustris]QJR14128.1 LL-diaminopimelate aminotransferase [Usitatibacter palustris]
MNRRLRLLQPYPFEKLRVLLAGARPPADLAPINISIGEPQHPTPAFLKDALAANAAGLSRYPLTRGLPELREAVAAWLAKRHGVAIDAATQVLPVAGSREALFSFAQATLDHDDRDSLVLCPNPFYQIYEGATLLGGATPYYVNALASRGFRPDWAGVPEDVWKRTRLLFTCSPNNPNGRVMPLDEWRELFALSDRYGFTIVSDECYSEIYFDESAPPLGALAAAYQLGRDTFERLVAVGSLSKRSNAPGLRSGFAAGDAALLEDFALYRTYHGTALSNTVQLASAAAWKDERHVAENRRLYREKFAAFYELVNPVLPLAMPEAAFYFWAAVPGDDEAFARELFEQAHVTVLPGSYLSRDAHGVNPGRGHIRIALVSTVDDAVEAGRRIRDFARQWAPAHAGAVR